MDVVGSVVKEQGVTFAVVQVHAYKIGTPQEALDTIQALTPIFPGLPVVVMAVGGEQGPTYWGRSDLANFMARTNPARFEWRKYSLQ